MKSLFHSSVIALGLAAIGAGCYSQPKPFVRMEGSLDVPAAQGKVVAKETTNGNTEINVDVEHLAPPDRVRAGATTYVVWARSLADRDYHNLGALQVDANLHGRLKTVTPMRSFEVMITAEGSPMATGPSSKRILSASIER